MATRTYPTVPRHTALTSVLVLAGVAIIVALFYYYTR